MTIEELMEAIKTKQAIAQSAYSAALLALGQAVYKSNRDQDLKCPAAGKRLKGNSMSTMAVVNLHDQDEPTRESPEAFTDLETLDILVREFQDGR